MTKVYTTVVDKSAGDTFTEAMWDTYLKDNINNLLVVPTVKARLSTAHILASSAWTAVPFTCEHWDTDGMHESVINPSYITIETAGKYLMTALIAFETSTGGTYRAARWQQEGGDVGNYFRMPILSTVRTEFTFTNAADLTSGTYIEVQAYQNGTTDTELAIGCHIILTRISG